LFEYVCDFLEFYYILSSSGIASGWISTPALHQTQCGASIRKERYSTTSPRKDTQILVETKKGRGAFNPWPFHCYLLSVLHSSMEFYIQANLFWGNTFRLLRKFLSRDSIDSRPGLLCGCPFRPDRKRHGQIPPRA